MKIITAPSVRVVSAPQFTPHPVYELPPHEVGAESLIATAGKVCYDSYGADGHPVDKHVRNLVNSGHHSVLEHVHVGLFIEGISRGCSHEIVRHRMFNYSQRSTRYTAEGDAAVVLDPYYAEIFGRDCELSALLEHRAPPEVREGWSVSFAELDLLGGFLNSCEASLREYQEQVRKLEALNPQQLAGRDLRKWCRGKARQLLPHALETRMVMTGNLRAWRHFLLMRTSRHAEAEIRRLAELVLGCVEPVAPTAFADLERAVVDGYVELTEASHG